MINSTTPPAVSIIIPCYNDGKYLPEAVASALAQTYAHIELIVVDDHSTDLVTKAALAAARERGIRVLTTPEGKKGVPAARNTGIAAATGKYILPLDADDKIAPTYVEKALKILEINPNIGICYCNARLFGLKNSSWRLPPYSWTEMLTGNIIFATALFRKSDWQRIGGYDESLVLGFEDYAFWLHLLNFGYRVECIEEELFYYRIKSGSLVASICKKNSYDHALIDLFHSCEPIFTRHTEELFLAVHKLKREKSSFTCLFSWKILSPVFRLEWFLRQKVKRLLGRA